MYAAARRQSGIRATGSRMANDAADNEMECGITDRRKINHREMERILQYQAETPITVREVLKKKWGLTDRQISRIKFLPEGLTVEGAHVTVRRLLRPGEILTGRLENAEKSSSHLELAEEKLQILYEDEDVAVIHKPAGVVVHPAHGHYRDTLVNMVYSHYRKQGQSVTVRPVGRLDQDTSGLILFAKNAVACQRLSRQKEDGTMVREYLALTEGLFQEKEGELWVPIGPEPGSLTRQQVRPDGKSAGTAWQVIKEYGRDYSLVRVKLYTGRTHQIRVHMGYMGHPLAGDPLYGTGEAQEQMQGNGDDGGKGQRGEKWNRKRYGMALHSWRITFRQPFDGREVVVAEAPEWIELI